MKDLPGAKELVKKMGSRLPTLLEFVKSLRESKAALSEVSRK